MTVPTPWSRFVLPGQYAATASGAPLAGGKLYFYNTGTTEPAPTFKDPEQSIPNKNPVRANGAGVFPNIFLAQQSYRVVLTDSNDVQAGTWDPVSPVISSVVTLQNAIVLSFPADGNGVAIPGGKIGDDYVPIDCTIVAAVLQADQAGSLEIDVWMAPFVTNTPPTVLNSIVASDPPTLSETQSSIDTTLDGWTTAVAAGTAVRYSVTSASVVTRFTLSLICQPAS